MEFRFRFLIGGVILAYVFLLFHLYEVQVARGKYYLAQAESQEAALGSILAKRGTIYFTDREGNRIPAATNKGYPVIYAVPKAIEDPLEAANQAALILGDSVEKLLASFSRKNATYVLLRKKPADPELVQKVREADIRGLYSEEVPGRFYPFGPLASHVLGFVSPNEDDNGESGKYGVENFYDKTLQGVPGTIEDRKIIPAKSGGEIVLTIDPTIQREAEYIIENLAKKYSAKRASVIVEEPKTGRIIAMASTPRFDPNRYSESDIGTFLNPLVEEIYEPGSVFKIFTMAAGIDSGSISPETKYYDTGKVVLNGKTIKNWDLKAHGEVTMTNVIEKSLNTGAAFAARKTGNSVFARYLRAFGFGDETGIDLPGELSGNLSRLHEKAPEINFATASFGQGVAITPLEVINAASVIANGGRLMRPYINESLGPEIIREVIGADAASKVAWMMVSAVDKAEVAHIDGFSIAGKTGTAQVPDLVRGGYTDRVINSYVGFGPVTNPRFAILIKLDEPAGAPLAGLTVVPAFRELAHFVINYYDIPPDRITEGN